jgi:uncharacterized protein (TIGR00266 family)
MQTSTGGGLGKLFGRALAGENLFINTYTAEKGGIIAFGAGVPGEIIPVDVGQRSIIAQKGSYLAAEKTVVTDIAFQKKMGVGLFGGEGFVLQKYSGSGIIFVSVYGSTVAYSLKEGQTIIVDSGAFAFAEGSVTFDIVTVKGLGNIIAGGEGLFNTVITGPGKIWLQTMPLDAFAKSLVPFLPFQQKS